MSEKKMRRCRLLAGLCGLLSLLFLFCERSDVITGAGGAAVSAESLFEDAQRAFVSVNLGPDDVDMAFSLPRGRDMGFSTHIQAGYLLMGVNGDGDTLAAHAQFRITAEFLAAALYGEEGGGPDGDELSTATLHFRVADNLDPKSSDPDVPDMPIPAVPIYLCESLDSGSTAPVKRGDKLDDIELDDLDLGIDSGATFSIPLRRAIFADRDPDGFDLAFCIVDYDGVLRKVGDPYMVAEGGDTAVTIQARHTRFTAFENDDGGMAGIRAAAPYSSWYTMRTAVFRIDLAKIMDTPGFSGSADSLVSAVIAIAANWGTAGEFAPIAGTDTLNVNRYKVLFFTDGDERFADAVNGADTAAVLQGIFDDRNTPEPALARPTDTRPVPFDPHSIRPLVMRALNNHSQDTADSHIYVYLRPTSENSTILWEKPLKLETILYISSLQ